VNRLSEVFVYLGEQPLLWLTLTLGAYLLAEQIYLKSGKLALLNPVLVAAFMIAGALMATGTAYEFYFRGAQFIHFLLGPAIIVLAVPVWRYRAGVWRARWALAAGLAAGAAVAGASAIVLGQLFGLDTDIIAALAPKSVTAPVAMGIAEMLAGPTALAALLAVLTGITGAVLVTPLFNYLGFADWRARGLATGVNCHGIGTAHAFQIHPVAGSFATVGMALNALFSALLLPPLFALMTG